MENRTIIDRIVEEKNLRGKAIRSLVFGILSIAISRVIGLVFGILAITQSRSATNYARMNGLKEDRRAKIGMILGIVGIIVSICGTIWLAFKFWAFFTALIASIRTGSLGVVGDYFQELGGMLSGNGF